MKAIIGVVFMTESTITLYRKSCVQKKINFMQSNQYEYTDDNYDHESKIFHLWSNLESIALICQYNFNLMQLAQKHLLTILGCI